MGSYDPDWNPDESDPFGDEPSDEDLDDIERDEDEEFGEDMEELMEHYTAETAEFNASEAAFTEKYGFTHNCRCAEDWEEGNLGVVSVCYLGMVTDAMDTLADTREELKDVKRSLAKLRIESAS